MISFFAKLLNAITKMTGSTALMILVYTLFCALVTFSFEKKNHQNILISKVIKEDLAEIQKKYKHNEKKSSDSISNLMIVYGYGLFQSIVCFLVEAVFGVILSISIKSEYFAYPTDAFGINLASSPKDSIISNTSTSIVCAIAMILAVVLQFAIDTYINNNTIADQRAQNVILTALVAAGCLFLPSAFFFYWLILKVINALELYATTHFNTDRFYSQLKNRVAKEKKEGAK